MKELIWKLKMFVLLFTQGQLNQRYQDLLAAGLEGMNKGVMNFKDGDRNAYLFSCAKNAILDELRKLNRWECEVNFSDMEKEPDIYCTMYEDEPMDLEQAYLHNEKVNEANWIAYCTGMHITPRQKDIMERNILRSSADAVSYRELADKWDCNKSTIQRDAKKVYKSLREKGNWWIIKK